MRVYLIADLTGVPTRFRVCFEPPVKNIINGAGAELIIGHKQNLNIIALHDGIRKCRELIGV
jgi:hypothetical protein